MAKFVDNRSARREEAVMVHSRSRVLVMIGALALLASGSGIRSWSPRTIPGDVGQVGLGLRPSNLPRPTVVRQFPAADRLLLAPPDGLAGARGKAYDLLGWYAAFRP
jgi:hypothetical protein